AGVEQPGPLGVDHGLVAHALELAQGPEGREPNSREPGRLDVAEVPAAALDAQDLDGLARVVDQPGLDRSIAAPVQDQARIPADQARAVHAQGEVLVAAGGPGVAGEVLGGFDVGPAAV